MVVVVDHTGRYVQLAYQLNGLLDKGCSVTPAEMSDHIRDGSLFDWLAEQFPFDTFFFDLTMLDAGERRTMLKVFGDGGVDGAVIAERNGLAVLLSYCLVVLQTPETFDDYRFDE